MLTSRPHLRSRRDPECIAELAFLLAAADPTNHPNAVNFDLSSALESRATTNAETALGIARTALTQLDGLPAEGVRS